jgi:hypothetical protein
LNGNASSFKRRGQDFVCGDYLLELFLCHAQLASITRTDPKTVQTLLRHADVATTLGIYAHSHSESRMTAQGDMLTAFFAPSARVQ